jgi:cell division protein FtsX
LIEVTLERNSTSSDREAVLDGLISVQGVARVDRGSRQAHSSAGASIDWLSRGGIVLGGSLWIVLFLVALGHYQSLFQRREAEIKLLKSFGAGQAAILAPVALEVLIQSAIATLLALLVILWGQAAVVDAFNHFFTSLGFSSFSLDPTLLFTTAVLMFSAALSAQVMGGITALIRSRAI